MFVEDPDDWDLRDKMFQWDSGDQQRFSLDNSNGMLTMRAGTPEGNYTLEFKVTEQGANISRHTVRAIVFVTVKEIPEEAVLRSGSIRLRGTTVEDFITRTNGISTRDEMQNMFSRIFNESVDNVDIFTVLTTQNNDTLIDVRFSVHGSPYFAPERLNSETNLNQEEVCFLNYLYWLIKSTSVIMILKGTD